MILVMYGAFVFLSGSFNPIDIWHDMKRGPVGYLMVATVVVSYYLIRWFA